MRRHNLEDLFLPDDEQNAAIPVSKPPQTANNLPQTAPPIPESDGSFATFQDSLLDALQRSIGYLVLCEFTIGTGNLQQKRGILYNVGRNSLVLQDPRRQLYTVCDLYSLKFMTVYDDGHEYNAQNRMRPLDFDPFSSFSSEMPPTR